MRMLSFLACILVLVACANASMAQSITDDKQVIVHFENGTVLQAELVQWNVGESYLLRLSTGQETRFLESDIKKIIDPSAQQITKRSKYNFDENALYYQLRLQIIGTNGGNRGDGVPGGSIALVAGRQWSQWLGTGIGVAYDKYFFDTGEDVVPIFADIMGYLTSSNVSPFYHLGIGYGIASGDSDFAIADARGGLFLNPSIGIRWGDKRLKWMFEIGYRIQDATFEYGNEFDPRNREINEIQYRRLSFGLILHY